ncbi:MAG: hypothetical protein R3324_05400 [Halobacteriales archaeon]|nr:hypothetical protein [Halobacteriales archaeon]
MRESTTYGRVDSLALTIGLGLVLFGVAVMGFFETVLGSVHLTQRIAGVDVIVVHTSFAPHGRAYLIALGFTVLLGWGVARVARSVLR